MADYKEKFVSEVSEALVGQINQSDIGIVSDEMTMLTIDGNNNTVTYFLA